MWLLSLVAACSLGPHPDTCSSDVGCRQAFGLGSQCTPEGFCSVARDLPRCEATWPEDLLTDRQAYGDAFVVGTLFRHGPDDPQLQSAQLAVKQLGSEPEQLLGREVGVVHCDVAERPELDALDIQGAVRSMGAYLTEELGVTAIVGPSSSDSTVAAYESLVGDDGRTGPVIISPSATSPLITDLDGSVHDDEDPGLLWRTVPPDDLQGIAIAGDLHSRGVDHISIIHQDGAYGAELAKVVRRQFEGTTDTFEFTNDNDRAVAIVDGTSAGADEVVFLSSEVEDIVAFFDAAATLPEFSGFGPTRIFLADGGADPFLVDNVSDGARDLFDLVRGTRPQVPEGPVLDVFKVAYSSEYGGEDPSDAVFAPYAYDATWLVLLGAGWADISQPELDGIGIARGIRQATRPDATETFPLQIASWPDIADAFEAQVPVDVDGASGTLAFDRETGEVSNPVEVWVFDSNDDILPVAVCDDEGSCEPI